MKLRRTFLLQFVWLVGCPFVAEVFGQSSPVAVKSQQVETTNKPENSKNGARSFEIEGDVIQGQRTRPDMFLDLKSLSVDLDEVIYTRSNFDDYYRAEKKMRPGFAK